MKFNIGRYAGVPKYDYFILERFRHANEWTLDGIEKRRRTDPLFSAGISSAVI